MLARFAAAVAALTLLAGAALADPAADLLAKAKAASGGDAWAQAVGYVSEGEGEVRGNDVDIIETVDLKTGGFLREFSALLGSGALGYDGTTAWSTSSFSSTQAVTDPVQLDGIRLLAFMNRRGLYKGEAMALRDLGAATLDGKALLGVEVTPQGLPPLELWFDAQTHLLDRQIRRADKVQEVRYSDWRPVDGLAFPYARQSFTDGEPGDHSTAETIQLVPSVDTSRFAMPQD